MPSMQELDSMCSRVLLVALWIVGNHEVVRMALLVVAIRIWQQLGLRVVMCLFLGVPEDLVEEEQRAEVL